jgi:hypothetical protein
MLLLSEKGICQIHESKPSHVQKVIVQLHMCVGPKGVYILSAVRWTLSLSSTLIICFANPKKESGDDHVCLCSRSIENPKLSDMFGMVYASFVRLLSGIKNLCRLS